MDSHPGTMSPVVFAIVVGCLLASLARVFKLLLRKSPFKPVPGPPSQSWLQGNLAQFYDQYAPTYHRSLVAKFGGAVKVPALFGNEFIYLSDTHAVQYLFGKGQQSFEAAPDFTTVTSLVFGPSILSTVKNAHKKHRKILNPVFSIAQMRLLFPLMNQITDKVRDNLLLLTRNKEALEIDMSEWLSRVAVELIGRAGFGHSFDDLSIDGGKQHVYTKAMKQLPIVSRKLTVLMIVLPLLDRLFPRWFLRVVSERLPWADLHKIMRIVDVMHETSKEVYEENKLNIAHENEAKTERQMDILSVLLRNNSNVAAEDRLEENEMIAQMSAIIFAGADTSSNTISRILDVLATHPEAQRRLRDEIIVAKQENGDGNLNYDQLMSLPYLDAVCRETLRLYAPVHFTSRRTQSDVILPLGRPVVSSDGKTELREIFLPEGAQVVVSLDAINRDTNVWGPEADEWNPERWMSPLPQTVADAKIPGVYSNMMTFVAGNRSCIGLSFALLEIKLLLSKLIDVLEFAHADNKEIVWLMSMIITPAVKGEEEKAPCLPLKVSAV